MNYDSKDNWQSAYNILIAYGRSNERALQVLKGNPRLDIEDRYNATLYPNRAKTGDYSVKN